MLHTDYGLPQVLDQKDVCFKAPKYAKFKLLIKFIKNSTLMRWFTFQGKVIQGKFYSGKRSPLRPPPP